MSVRHLKCRYFLSDDMHCTRLYTVEPNSRISNHILRYLVSTGIINTTDFIISTFAGVINFGRLQ